MRGTWGIGGMLPNIAGNVLKHSWECVRTCWGMSSNTLGNVLKHSRECCQKYWGMPSNIPGNVLKHSGECLCHFLEFQGNEDAGSVQEVRSDFVCMECLGLMLVVLMSLSRMESMVLVLRVFGPIQVNGYGISGQNYAAFRKVKCQQGYTAGISH